MKIFLLFYICHFAMGLTHCYKTTVIFYIYRIYRRYIADIDMLASVSYRYFRYRFFRYIDIASVTSEISVIFRYLPASLREAQPCRYCIYSVVQTWVFRLAGETHYPDKREYRDVNATPKTIKFSHFGREYAPQRRLVCTLFTKLSAFVRASR